MPQNLPFFPSDFDLQSYENWLTESQKEEFEESLIQDHEAREHYDLIVAFA